MTTPEPVTETWVPELTFAARLALVRHRMGWNIKEAALACGISPQSWRGWEIEHRLPHDQLDVVQRISQCTGVDDEWLLRGGPSRPTRVAPLGPRVVTRAGAGGARRARIKERYHRGFTRTGAVGRTSIPCPRVSDDRPADDERAAAATLARAVDAAVLPAPDATSLATGRSGQPSPAAGASRRPGDRRATRLRP